MNILYLPIVYNKLHRRATHEYIVLPIVYITQKTPIEYIVLPIVYNKLHRRATMNILYYLSFITKLHRRATMNILYYLSFITNYTE